MLISKDSDSIGFPVQHCFTAFLKMSRDLMLLVSAGREFHGTGPAVEK